MEWIPINEQLPEPNQHILLFLKNDDKTAQVVGYLFFNDTNRFENLNDFNGEFSSYSGGELPDFLKQQ